MCSLAAEVGFLGDGGKRLLRVYANNLVSAPRASVTIEARRAYV